MALSTYAELQEAITGWLARDDLSSVTPDLIRLAEARLSRELRVWNMVSVVAGTLDAGSMAAPSDFLEVVSFAFAISPRCSPSYLPPETLLARPDAGETGLPRFMTFMAGSFIFAPAAVTPGYDYELAYYASIPPLSTTDPNWLLTKAPDAYLFASLCEAEPYLKNDERLAMWQGRLKLAVDQLNGNDRRARSMGMGQRMRVV